MATIHHMQNAQTCKSAASNVREHMPMRSKRKGSMRTLRGSRVGSEGTSVKVSKFPTPQVQNVHRGIEG